MMERHEHTNPWADKLQEVQLPDANDSWSAMAGLLDKEMPLLRNPNRRRWLLLIILLLLLIGVCNCPGRRGKDTGSNDDKAGKSVVTDTSTRNTGADKTGSIRSEEGANILSEGKSRIGTDNGSSKIGTDTGRSRFGKDTGREIYEAGTTGRSAIERERGGGASTEGKESGEGTAQRINPGNKQIGENTIGGMSTRGKTSEDKTIRSRNPRSKTTGGSTIRGRKPVAGKIGVEVGDDTVTGTETIGREGQTVSDLKRNSAGQGLDSGMRGDHTGKKDADTAALPKTVSKNFPIKKPLASDTKKTPAADTAQKETARGLLVGVGFNQFFSVGRQQRSDYNSGGTSGGLGDYLPVPMVRYYFNPKFYVQLEAQFNAPQYTKKNLVAGQSTGDTLPSGHVQQNSVTIQKLFYFNLPLSVHYSPVRNLYLGAGLQYSRLSNGVGLYQNKVLVTGGTDSIKVSKIYSFKGDSIYRKIRTNELRFLVDMNYNYWKFILGVRYNQALSRFLDVHISNTEVTQARNSSLQLYLRYIIWDNRKKKKS